ncbi:alpha-ketoacid dehydrogenase subunit beta [Paenibacillus sp. SEL3]|jgi:2-oxoisovalerate dehydrogenase E1 component beta subunit|uniref:Alpha-ketoacid dehydrogenase subunit beta n=1 Tax=Paenibacillus polymyxa TaxID=1406 RepID=A0A8I1IYB7_PAEPO|nr:MULTISPECIES: alpha-ketoacid dehydrogenase subunit beta [Paenibacillus]KAF6575210.1 alpha-ketoacid dehydrogenase subunit beta [Paenibacillus sp. EKM206P]KAF6590117.1 alpha-ketoacid dehydrogenase subunit beta [Paenibacillus sp. EKM205P]MBM0632535.1 alpha-ketoacid dehydrogenase subunit beta [Paenibacillus polymyxa]MBO3286671.1 alpha-ketoacid dehydrogenase subunit beta [Paenibacillus polymyxa]MDQ0046276.1 2-oxoisovalerate dehydrogenase E1 component beta subunit [Paenibacillus polymyxa]
MAIMEYIDAIRLAMKEEMEQDETVFVLGEDVGVKGGVFTTTKGLMDQFGEQRVMDTPLAESAIAGVAIGAAMYGMKPIAEMQYSDFMLPATNQIISEAAKIRYRSNNDWNCPVVIRAPIGGGIFGGLYHSQCPESIFFGTPGLKIVAPFTPYDAKGLLKAAIRDPDPVLFFENKKSYKLIKGEVPEDDYIVPIGKANLLREGDDITVIGYSQPLHFVMQAAEELEKEEGITAQVVDLRTLQPLDREAIVEAARHTGKVLIVHEDNKTGGIGAEVSAIINEECLFELDAPIERLCAPDVPAMPISPPMEKFYMLNKDKVKEAMRRLAMY